MLVEGLHERIIDESLGKELAEIDATYFLTEKVDEAEASKILSRYLYEVVSEALGTLRDDEDGLQAQVNLVNSVVQTVAQSLKSPSFESRKVPQPVQELLAYIDTKNSIESINGLKEIVRPTTSLASSSLFTGAKNEPSMYSELSNEIRSCDSIDFLISFIRWTGLRLILEALQYFTGKGRRLRIITTTYMGATDLKAIEELAKLPNTEIRISYDTNATRLHAKAYMFYRKSGYTTAYIGSSNLSRAALSDGLEWNVKISKKELPDTLRKITYMFDNYWNDSTFEAYDSSQNERLAKALMQAQKGKDQNTIQWFFDANPYEFQKVILDKLQAEREIHGMNRNLVVAATGTGKTMIAAFDYKRYQMKNMNNCRLLFVAHREEILLQSRACFRGVMKDPNFGDLMVGNHPTLSIDYLFISIQSLESKNLIESTTPDYYDFIIVDEFHRAAAPTYRRMLDYYKPKIFLGLTATPERMDGKDILPYFNYRMAAEIRLPEAIEKRLLCPFHYFGVTDEIDLSSIKWQKGGYDRQELSKVYSMESHAANKRAEQIIRSINRYVTDMGNVKALGFCVSVDHALFMAKRFNASGLSARALTGDSPQQERDEAKSWIQQGDCGRYLFVVDLYNEGVDIPEINTVLFLRPTESLTVFLQQLGRGLRLSDNKECLTVLDFIGQANKKYRFETKFSALLTRADRSIKQELKVGFISVPKGCCIQLEKIAQSYVLQNINQALSGKNAIIDRIRSFSEDSQKELTLANFLDFHRMDIRDLYKSQTSFRQLCIESKVILDDSGSKDPSIEKALLRIASINSRSWIVFLLSVLRNLHAYDLKIYQGNERRMLLMFLWTIWDKESLDIDECLQKISAAPHQRQEIIDILTYNLENIDFIEHQLETDEECPLAVNCTYTRDQILIALDYFSPSTVRQGVLYLKDRKVDVLFNTINKSERHYSPSTMYEDYAIDDQHFHWQSQSKTTPESPTGRRYVHHEHYGSKVYLFVRENKSNQYDKAAPYTFLGPASYVSHTGTTPMSIIWALKYSIPSRFKKSISELA